MGVIHEVLIVVGLVLLLLIGWSFSVLVQESMVESRSTMHMIQPQGSYTNRLGLATSPPIQPRG